MSGRQNQTDVVVPDCVIVNGRARLIGIAIQVLILSIAVFILVMSFAMKVIGDYQVMLPGAALPLPEGCTSKALFGVSCPGCGLTRAMISLSNGELDRAWMFNPASFLLYPFLILQIPWRLFQLFRLIRNRPIVFSIWLFIPIFAIVGVLILQWFVRMFI